MDGLQRGPPVEPLTRRDSLADPPVTAAPARAVVLQRGDDLTIVLAGDWRLEQGLPRFRPPAKAESPSGGLHDDQIRTIRFDTAELGAWDSSVLVYLHQAYDFGEVPGIEIDASDLPEPIARLIALSRAVPEHVPDAGAPARSLVARVGQAALYGFDALRTSVTFTGQVTDGFIRLVLGRVRLRWRDFWVVVQSNGSGALPIVTLIAFLIGVIIAFLGVVVLRRFGAGFYVSYLVGYGVLREMGALMTGIIMAGRTGAAFAAELGSMKITEEIDAYTTLGVSAVDHLVLPRILGLFVMMPLLVIYADFVGIAGGLLVAVTMLDLSPTQFFGGLLTAVALPDALIGLFKGSVFGLIIGLAGCMKGLQTGSDAGAVGRAATSAVVLGITLIIMANAVIDWLAALLQI
jgi:phospholipid/cholesterol/gamma-HCH transport system permease protein